MTKQEDIELIFGGWWFTTYADGKGTIQGPFKTKYEAEKAKKAYDQVPEQVVHSRP